MGYDYIAIVGAACRLPQADDLQQFKTLLLQGGDAVSEIPKDRWARGLYFDPDPKQPGKAYTFSAGVLDDIYGFDAEFFGLSPREAANVDPQQRLLLELAIEALEDSGVRPSRLSGAGYGVYIGGSAWDYATTKVGDISLMDAHSMQGMALSSMSNRISYMLDLRGPSMTVDTACSSSLVALDIACRAILRGEIPGALVGGVNMLVSPQGFVGFSRASMLSPTGRCHAFGARADGYVRAEGGGVLVLKPLDAAIADGDQIRAVIRGTGVNSDGRTSSFSVPSSDAQARLLFELYAKAGIEPDQLAYLEAHGTGTPVGDPIEAAALGRALGARRTTPLAIGSVKTNVGHLEAASGMAGVLKALVVLETGVIPATLHCDELNSAIPFGDLNLQVVREPRPLERRDGAVLVGVNSFGFGGTNGHVVLAAPPEPVRRTSGVEAQPSLPPLAISARSEDALRALAARWRDMLAGSDHDAAARALRAAARHRDPLSHRLISSADAPAELAADLAAWISGDEAPDVLEGRAVEGRTAFVFSGNGSQWAEMGRKAFAGSKPFRAAIDAVDAHLAAMTGWRVADRLTGAVAEDELRRTEFAQPLLFAIQVAAVEALAAQGVKPDAVVGHSVGEVAAAWAAGALSLEEACRVVSHRSRLQQLTHGRGGMAAVSAGAARLRQLLPELGIDLEIAAINSASSTTLAGADEALRAMEAAAEANGWPMVRLDLDYAFHSSAMTPVRDELLGRLSGLSSANPERTFVSTVTGEPVAAGDLDAEYWWRNVRDPVLFEQAVDRLIQGGARLFVEIGPQPVLQGYVRTQIQTNGAQGVVLPTLTRRDGDGDPFKAIAARCFVGGVDISEAPQFAGECDHRAAPSYPWRRQRHWVGCTSERVELIAPEEDGQLLGFRRGEATDRWINHLSVSRMPWLKDHRVDGAVILPGAGVIDMALSALRARCPDAAVLEINDLELLRPVLLDDARETQLELGADGAVTLSSRPRLDEEARTVHARGRASAHDSGPSLFAPRRHDQAIARTIERDEFYATTRRLKMDYGPAFQVVSQAVVYGPELAEVRFDPEAVNGAAALGAVVNPALLDGALQGILATKSLEHTLPGDSVLPWRFGRIRLLRQGSAPAKAQLRVTRIGPRAHSADIALLDAAGAVVLELLDCWFVRVRPGAVATAENAYRIELAPTAAQHGGTPQLALEAAQIVDPAGVPQDECESGLLARAFLNASAYAGLQQMFGGSEGLIGDVQARLPAETWELIELLVESLAQDGWAAYDGERIRLHPLETPSAADIFQTLLFDYPDASAETALLARAATALFGDASGEPPAALRQQVLLSSPSSQAGHEALLASLQRIADAWPQGRPLRIAVVGAVRPGLVQTLQRRLVEKQVPSRIVAAIGPDEDGSPLAAALAAQPAGGLHRLDATAGSLSDQLGRDFDLVIGGFACSDLAVPVKDLVDLLGEGGWVLALEAGADAIWPAALMPHRAQSAQSQLTDLAELYRQAGCADVAVSSVSGVVWTPQLLCARLPALGRLAAEGASCSGDIAVVGYDDLQEAQRLAQGLQALNRPAHALSAEEMKPELLRNPALNDLVILAPATLSDEAADEQALAQIAGHLAAHVRTLAGAREVRLFIVVRGLPGDLGPEALGGLRRVMLNEGLGVRMLAVDPALSAEVFDSRVAAEICRADEELEVFITRHARLAPRLTRGLPPTASAPAGPRRLQISRPGILSTLTWEAFQPAAPEAGEVAIEVKAAGLNFRDVMWGMGLLPDEALIDGFSGPTLGLECTGVVTAVGPGVADLAVGDRVAALAPWALSTQVVTGQHAAFRLPQGMDFAAAATLPVTALTTVYALGRLADVQPGERVLIHGGLGGVGLTAIQYALHRGAEVYATAGSKLRRELLRLLGLRHVFDSRSPEFADELLAVTGGEGVDVVLNSLSGEFMQASLRLLRPFGRFVEIGKRDLFANTQIGLRPLRNNIAYFTVDADQLAKLRPALATQLLREVAQLVDEGVLRPLPHRSYDFSDVTEAFRLMQGSGHIGKVVLRPDEEPPAAPQPAARREFVIRPDRTYVVTGGLGGFGLATAVWLAERGAKRLALLGRRGDKTPGAAEILDSLRAKGCEADALACDVADEAALGAVLAKVRQGGAPIGGVVHAAMTMDDGLLTDLTEARFAASLRPKVRGARALDRLTRQDPLDFFILYSSVSVAIGNPGQGNYVVSNAGMEAVAHARRRLGLPATAIQWGPISDAGYLARTEHVKDVLERILGSDGLNSRDALEALPGLVESGATVAGCASLDWTSVKRQLPTGASTLFEAIKTSAGPQRERAFAEEVAHLPLEEAEGFTLEVLTNEVAQILRMNQDSIDPDRPIGEMGFDSLMALELRLAIEGQLGQELPLLAVSGSSTLRSIAQRVVSSARGGVSDDEDGAGLDRVLRHEEIALESVG